MNRQATDVQLVEIAEQVEELLHGHPARFLARRLVTELSLRELERRVIRQMERNGIGGIRAERSLAEYRQERERLTARNDEPSGAA